MKKTGNRLRVLRAEVDITQVDLARRTAIQAMRYWKIENGYLEPTADECKSLAKALRVKVEALGFAASCYEEAKAS